MVKKINILGLNIKFVFRHKWDSKAKRFFDIQFRMYQIGLFYKKSKIVGEKDFSNPKSWNNNLVGSYMFGIKLIFAHTWVEIDYKGKHFELKQ